MVRVAVKVRVRVKIKTKNRVRTLKLSALSAKPVQQAESVFPLAF